MSTPTINGVETLKLPCCACVDTVSFADPEKTTHPTFFHTMPYCAHFDSTNTADELVTYLKDCIDFQTEIERK